MIKLLNEITIPTQCPVTWASMKGDELVRNCSACSRKVHNLSAMSENEAEQFLRQHGTSECITFFRRTDGKVMTENCPAILRKVRNRAQVAASFATGLIASLFLFATGKACAQSSSEIADKNKISPKLTAASFQGQGQLLGIGVFPIKKSKADTKEKCGKDWHNPGYRAQLGKSAFKEYEKARSSREKKHFADSYEHYKRVLAICSKMDSFGDSIPKLRVIAEMEEVQALREQ